MTVTLQQKLGFIDSDLRSPEHDQIMQWLDRECRQAAFIQCLIGWSPTFSDDEIQRAIAWAKKDYPGLEDPPEMPPPRPPIQIDRVIWEHPLTSSGKYIVGFIDLVVDVQGPVELQLTKVGSHKSLKWQPCTSRATLCFEVKSRIKSIGELVRQIALYRACGTGSERYFVVAPAHEAAQRVLKSQGVGFISAPPETTGRLV